MESNVEIRRLIDIMPASGRMMAKIVSKPEQAKVIDANFPLPWNRERPVYINFDLWRRLTKPQRDLLLLRMVCWVVGIKWFKPDIYQGVAIAGILGGFVESSQSDAVGIVVAAGLSTLAIARIWTKNRSQESEIDADVGAIRIAQRRGYAEAEAAESLLSAIEAVAYIEKRPGLTFTELIRCQNLRAIAGLSSQNIPQGYE
ncbi:DUF3318 domain-containing protein [Calothrix sp. 336/3]|uniref:DUF3318 domain-containing protein n=1 Tax=Calothrix sp. 336/3 TaxID=1337936 RepID=UPI0004E3CD93|nr:DUF3318 domain-containing protein [Calothrix sp. 336/3]AKG23411.1 hypothetical protein IJ00_20935 [Calothrix sp. 336/3]